MTSQPPRHANHPAGFARLDEAGFPLFQPGTVWLAGAGPGAPGLLSLLAYHGLQHCDCVIYDALVNPAILDWLPAGRETIYAGKRGGKPSPAQGDISRKLVALARAGKRVLRLKGGDPFMFGRGGEECQALADAGIAFRIVPGITAGIGGLAYAGIPATHRDTNHAVIFVTGHDASGRLPSNVDWTAIATAAPVIVMYMALKSAPDIARALIAGGRDPADTVTFISNATLPHQSMAATTLGEVESFLSANHVATPAIVVAGPVERWRGVLDWYDGPARRNPLG